MTESGVFHHVEAGTCPSAPALDREALYRIIHAADPQRVITSPDMNLMDQEKQDRALALYEVAQQVSRGTGWECCLCQRGFTSWRSLCQHLDSAAHKQGIYHCPDCQKPFSCLGGLFSHLESKSCGPADLKQLQTIAQLIMGFIAKKRA